MNKPKKWENGSRAAFLSIFRENRGSLQAFIREFNS
jgi:hypothetical protein